MNDERELLVRLDREAAEPLTTQLSDALRDAVRAGRLQPGSRLPASRTLATDLQVSRGVVVEAYEQLVSEGYLVGRAGGGTRVNPAAGRPPQVTRTAGWRPWHRHPGAVLVDARPGVPDLGAFPRADWQAALGHALRNPAELAYAAPWGVPALREQLAGYLGRVRRAVAAPDTLVVTSGATQALTIMTRTLARRGHQTLAVEDPSNAVQRGLLASHGLRVLDVPVDAEGVDVGALAATPARAVLLTPAHQYPTGVTLSPGRRQALLRWARDVDGVVIEDDYDAEFRYDGQRLMCLQSDDPMRVALVGSISKTLAPGLRLGWVMPPMGLVAAVAETKRDDDFGSDVLTQLAFAQLLESGRYDRHLRTVRRTYGMRRERLTELLARALPDWTVLGDAAGQHLAVQLPVGLSEPAVARHAYRRGLLVLEMAAMRGRPGPAALVLGFARLGGTMPEHVVSILAAAAGDARDSTLSSTRRPGPAPEDLLSAPPVAINAEDFFPPATGPE